MIFKIYWTRDLTDKPDTHIINHKFTRPSPTCNNPGSLLLVEGPTFKSKGTPESLVKHCKPVVYENIKGTNRLDL